MPTEISANDLNRILSRWEGYDLPQEAQEGLMEFITKVTEKIGDLVFLIDKFETNTAFELGEKAAEIVAPSFMLCYYIGYELASGKMSRSDCTSYLMAATHPVQTFVLNIFGMIVAKGITSQEQGKEIALEIARLIGETSNEICILGIQSFRKIGY